MQVFNISTYFFSVINISFNDSFLLEYIFFKSSSDRDTIGSLSEPLEEWFPILEYAIKIKLEQKENSKEQ